MRVLLTHQSLAALVSACLASAILGCEVEPDYSYFFHGERIANECTPSKTLIALKIDAECDLEELASSIVRYGTLLPGSETPYYKYRSLRVNPDSMISIKELERLPCVQYALPVFEQEGFKIYYGNEVYGRVLPGIDVQELETRIHKLCPDAVRFKKRPSNTLFTVVLKWNDLPSTFATCRKIYRTGMVQFVAPNPESTVILH